MDKLRFKFLKNKNRNSEHEQRIRELRDTFRQTERITRMIRNRQMEEERLSRRFKLNINDNMLKHLKSIGVFLSVLIGLTFLPYLAGYYIVGPNFVKNWSPTQAESFIHPWIVGLTGMVFVFLILVLCVLVYRVIYSEFE